MAQPPLSVSIRKLEEELHLKLFDRHPRGAVLTPAGELAWRLAQEIDDRAKALRTLAEDLGEGHRGQLSVAFVTSATFSLVPLVVPAFRRRFPTVELRLKEATTHDVLEGLRKGELDIGLIRTPIYDGEGVTLTPLSRETLMLAVSPGHPLAGSSSVRLEDLADEPFILFDRASNLRVYIVVCCEAAGFLPRVAEEVTHVHTMIALVESGMGVGLLASNGPHGRLDTVRFIPVTLAGKAIATGLALAARAEENNVLAHNFASVAREFAGPEEPVSQA